MKRRLSGFTLIELIVVVAIITVLAMVIVPSTIYQIRSSRVESANDHANELYSATQNYLINLQRRGIDCKTMFGVKGSTKRYWALGYDAQNDEYVSAVADSYSIVSGSTNTYNVSDVSADNDDHKNNEAIQGIKKQLSGSISQAQNNSENWYDNSSWLVLVDTETYNVKIAVFCELINTDCTYALGYSEQFGTCMFTSLSPYVSKNEQVDAYGQTRMENQSRKGCGQYPIPVY